MAKKWRIGTRGSKLALWQAHWIQSMLHEEGEQAEIIVIKTQGDQIQNLGFDKLEGKGFFTKEIEQKLAEEDIDIAVHSLKDLPTEQHEHLKIAALTERANPADCLLTRVESVDKGQILNIKKSGVVGTSSLRRQAFLEDLREDLQVAQLRGNVPTRLKKLREGKYDAIVLAQAGLDRIGADISDLNTWTLSPREFIPAAGQGVVAVQIRRNDPDCEQAVQQLHRREVAICTNVERKVLSLMEGGCHIPLGVYCEQDALNNFHVWAAWQPPNESLRRVKVSFGTTHNLAEEVVNQLRDTNTDQENS